MKLPISIANKLLIMMEERISAASSSLTGPVIEKMIDDSVLQKIQISKTKASLFVGDVGALKKYLFNQFGIADLADYVEKVSTEELTRSEAVTISGNSKLKTVRTFKGFLVNCYSPVPATLNEKPFVVNPVHGSFTFIYDYDAFVPDKSVTIVGIENTENFRYVERQQYLFTGLQPLFVSRYPQTKDLVNWLQFLPNRYLHFGDLDFAGINIYLNEYKRNLREKASFYIPENVEELLQKFGNRDLYHKQSHLIVKEVNEVQLIELVNLFHLYKKVLEQEVFIKW